MQCSIPQYNYVQIPEQPTTSNRKDPIYGGLRNHAVVKLLYVHIMIAFYGLLVSAMPSINC